MIFLDVTKIKFLLKSTYLRAGCSEEDQEISLWSGAHIEDSVIQNDPDKFLDPFATEGNSSHDPVSQFMGTVPMPENTSSQDPPEMYLPGVIIHIVTETKSSLWIGWGGHAPTHKAYIANRESFKDIIVSPSMFLDHFPWRYCNRIFFFLLNILVLLEVDSGIIVLSNIIQMP